MRRSDLRQDGDRPLEGDAVNLRPNAPRSRKAVSWVINSVLPCPDVALATNLPSPCRLDPTHLPAPFVFARPFIQQWGWSRTCRADHYCKGRRDRRPPNPLSSAALSALETHDHSSSPATASPGLATPPEVLLRLVLTHWLVQHHVSKTTGSSLVLAVHLALCLLRCCSATR